ncbi:N-acetylmuramoyl-L-alanine amidase [Acidovorax sp. LjRoot117]|jgi:peptidoglycan hydrolase-like protein with peptidoglycan-binding domain
MAEIKITSPIGKTVGNTPHEVRMVQQALNRHMNCKLGYRPIKEDGRLSSETLEAIRIFQEMIGIIPVDSIILPNGATHRALNQSVIRILNPSAACMIADQEKVRQIIIDRVNIVERKAWQALNPAKIPLNDWGYQSIAIHHAGNSFSCGANGVDALKQAEKIDMKSFNQISYHYAIDCKGIAYEALDIRHKGAHIEKGNTGVIGIVFLADLSVRGEAARYGPGVANVTRNNGVRAGVSEFLGVQKDRLAVAHDEPSELQLSKAEKLVKTLAEFFPIRKLGGHREFAQSAGTSRACPGIYGMIIAEQLRMKFGFAKP